MKIEELTLEQLKSLAYDCLLQIEQSQNNLKIINAEIGKRNSNMSEENTEEVVEPTPLEVGDVTPEEEAE